MVASSLFPRPKSSRWESTNVICTDKTGTLTTGVMTVRECWGKDHKEVLRAACAPKNEGARQQSPVRLLLRLRRTMTLDKANALIVKTANHRPG